MSDKRPYAKIDTGYVLNPKWFQVERYLRSVLRIDERIVIRNAIRAAREAHLASILYCAQNVTDGEFPVETIKALAIIQTDEEEAAITALFEVGLWVNLPGGMAEVHDYLEHQTSAEKIKQLRAAGRKAADARRAKTATNRSTNRSTEEKRREEKLTPPNGGVGADRATRIPLPFEVTPEMKKWAADNCPDIDPAASTEQFVDYWRARSGKDATKLDWNATWRNWLRRDQEWASNQRGGRNQDQIMRDMQHKAAARTAAMRGSALALIEGGNE